MKIGDYIKKYREEHELSGRAFADLVGISPQYVNMLERGLNNDGKPISPTITTYHKIAVGTGITENELLAMLDDTVKINPKAEKANDSEIMRKYNALDDHGKKVVNLVLNAEHERCVGKSVADLPEKKTKVIPLFPAAAGPGEPMDTTAIQEYEVDADSKAQFAVRISGDSMEPELHDGEIVLCKARRAQIGEFAVIMVNGFLLVKQYIEDCYGNFYLRSYNRDRKDLDYDHYNFSNDTVTGYGVVIHRKVPLVHE